MSYEMLDRYEYFLAVIKKREALHGQRIYWIPYMELKLRDNKGRIIDLDFDVFFPPYIKNRYRIFALIRRLPKDRREILANERDIVLKPNLRDVNEVYNLWRKTYEEAQELYYTALSREIKEFKKLGFFGRLFMPMIFRRPIDEERAQMSRELSMAMAIAKNLLKGFEPIGEYSIVWCPFNITQQENTIQFYDLSRGCEDNVYTSLTRYDEGMRKITRQLIRIRTEEYW